MFAYDDAVAKRYPTIRAGVIHATNLANGPSSPEVLDEYRTEQRAASERLNVTAIADLPSIVAWRHAFARFGAKPTHHRSLRHRRRTLHRPRIYRQRPPGPRRSHFRGRQRRRERSALVLAPERPESHQRDHR